MVQPQDFGEKAGNYEREAIGDLPVEESDQEAAYRGKLVEPDNEAHAPDQVCERCGNVITGSQDARLEPDGRWVHEQCPGQ